MKMEKAQMRFDFGKALTEVMEEKNCDPNSLAHDLRTSRQSIMNYRNGAQTPNVLTFRRICKVLGVPYSRILGEE